ncbi:MAG: hypothetical protein LUG46_09070 [Erysipelotrichaceae bacterium]|nr:hypothetical protein [Erysipelotrichaceae bacterium]
MENFENKDRKSLKKLLAKVFSFMFVVAIAFSTSAMAFNTVTTTSSNNAIIQDVYATTSITKCTFSSVSAKTYTGSQIKPSVTVKYKGKTLTKGTHYTVSYGTNTDAGTGTITIKGKGSYSGTKTIKFTINKATYSPTVKAYSGTYDGKSHTITISNVKSGSTIKYRTSTSDSWSSTKPSRKSVGTTTVYYKITNDNYSTISSSAKITIKEQTVTLKKTTLSLVRTSYLSSTVEDFGNEFISTLSDRNLQVGDIVTFNEDSSLITTLCQSGELGYLAQSIEYTTGYKFNVLKWKDSKNNYTKITFELQSIDTSASLSAMTTAAYNACKSAGVTTGMTQTNAVKKINTWICKKVTYNSSYNTMASGFNKGKGVCQTYGMMFDAMCQQCGITQSDVHGTANGSNGWESHLWNKVKLNGTWYYIDVCWNDTCSNKYLLSKSLWSDHKLSS